MLISSQQSDTGFREFLICLEPFEQYYHLMRQQQALSVEASALSLQSVFQESADAIRYKIEQLFIPLLQDVLASDPKPDSKEVDPLYVLVPRIRNYLALSVFFMSGSMEYLSSPEGIDKRQQLQALLGRATEIMEYHASYYLERLLRGMSEQTVSSLLTAFTDPAFKFKDAILDFERIPAAHAEIAHCGFTSTDHMLFIGCGSLSISGLAYANAGARVTLVDIDPCALESFSRVYSALPRDLQKRLHRQVVTPGDYCYINQDDYNYIGLAGLVGAKDEILRSVQHCLHCRRQMPTLLIRAPKPNLLKLFYYDARLSELPASYYQISEPGIEAPLQTNILRFNLTERLQDRLLKETCPHTEQLKGLFEHCSETPYSSSSTGSVAGCRQSLSTIR